MKAVSINEKGSLDNIRIEDVPKPIITPNKLLIKVKACGLNPVDWKGVELGFFEMPYVLGTDISGIVEEVGSETSKFSIGDEVIGSLEWSKQGAFAEYIISEEKYISKKPINLNFEEAAGVPLASLTAWQGLFDKLELKAGEKILIQAAAGGVGLFAIQFAKMIGAHVVAVASKKNEELVKSFGAEEVIDYTQVDLKTIANDFDAVFDSMATAPLLIPHIKHGGRYISITAKPDQELAEKHGVKASNFLFYSDPNQLDEIVGLIEKGKIKIILDQLFPLDEAKNALIFQKKGHSRGKNILLVG